MTVARLLVLPGRPGAYERLVTARDVMPRWPAADRPGDLDAGGVEHAINVWEYWSSHPWLR